MPGPGAAGSKESAATQRDDVPDVLGQAVLDELLVLVLVGAHVDGVVAGVRPRLVVEHHH
jgi:hypothetical protein